MQRIVLLVSIGLAFAACSDSPDYVGPQRSQEAVEAAADPLGHMRSFIEEFKARAEHADPSVEVQHILISFRGAPRMPPTVTRTKEEAERLAAELYAKILADEDFGELVKEYTNDSYPGIYPMDQAGRSGMVPAFGNTAWRLKVGEVGIAPHHETESPFGWHIIKRIL